MLPLRFLLVALGLLVLWASPASAELLALLNYESKPGQPVRREGIAIMEIDPESPDFGKILMDIPLPSDVVAHHIFFNRDKSKAYVTSLGKSILLVVDLTKFPYRLRTIDVPDCQVNEDLVVSEDNKTWFLTCMGSSNVVMGDAQTDKPIKTISSSEAAAFILYPHGIAIHNGIDRVLVTSTVKPDMSDQGDTVTVLEAKSGKVLSTHKVASKPSPAKSAPVEVMFSPNSNPPVVHITNMLEGTLWAGVWDPKTKAFTFNQVDDFGAKEQGMPLEMLYNKKGDRLFVTTAKTGFVNLYDNSDPRQPKFIKAIPSAPGAHHSVLSPDERYLFVQNSFLNLEGMSNRVHYGDRCKNSKVLGNMKIVEICRVQSQLHQMLPNHFPNSGLRANVHLH